MTCKVSYTYFGVAVCDVLSKFEIGNIIFTAENPVFVCPLLILLILAKSEHLYAQPALVLESNTNLIKKLVRGIAEGEFFHVTLL